jgi:hypothetical protein
MNLPLSPGAYDLLVQLYGQSDKRSELMLQARETARQNNNSLVLIADVMEAYRNDLHKQLIAG